MESLKGLVNMLDLTLSKCQVGDDGLKPLVGMLRLRSLTLSDTQVTRKGLETIKKFTELQVLDMTNCPLLDDGDLKHFLDLPQLMTLILGGTSVTAEGMGRLRAAKPGLKTFP
jgi:Leucine-rich repeat (LRR) protein